MKPSLTSLTLASLAALGITLSSGAADARPAGPMKQNGVFAQIDTNNDGRISLQEMMAAKNKKTKAATPKKPKVTKPATKTRRPRPKPVNPKTAAGAGKVKSGSFWVVGASNAAPPATTTVPVRVKPVKRPRVVRTAPPKRPKVVRHTPPKRTRAVPPKRPKARVGHKRMTAAKRFALLDLNKDGFISASEMRRAQARRDAKRAARRKVRASHTHTCHHGPRQVRSQGRPYPPTATSPVTPVLSPPSRSTSSSSSFNVKLSAGVKISLF